MNLLLILSALLSALSGLAGSGRSAERQQVVACPGAAVSATQHAPAIAPRNVVPTLRMVVPSDRSTLLPTPWRLIAVIAPWAMRQRE